MSGRLSRPGATVTGRALALIGAFDEQHRTLTLTELAARADLPVPTAHRLLGELMSWGAIERETGGTFVIGRRLWDAAMLAPVQRGLREVASPYLHDLYAATRATVHLAVRDGTSVLYVDRLRGQASVRVVSTIGSRLPMHATGVGKALLAYAPESIREEVLATLTRITAYTIVQPGRLRQQLDRVRTDGFAQAREEMTLGACSLAVPIQLADGTAEAALGIVVPTLARGQTQLVPALRVAARGISRALGTSRVVT